MLIFLPPYWFPSTVIVVDADGVYFAPYILSPVSRFISHSVMVILWPCRLFKSEIWVRSWYGFTLGLVILWQRRNFHYFGVLSLCLLIVLRTRNRLVFLCSFKFLDLASITYAIHTDILPSFDIRSSWLWFDSNSLGNSSNVNFVPTPEILYLDHGTKRKTWLEDSEETDASNQPYRSNDLV